MDDETKDQVQRALNRGYYYLKFRPRTEQEVHQYLHKKAERFHWPEIVVEQAIKELKEQGLINDQSFIEWFVDQRSSAKPKSIFALKSEMMRFGIKKDLLDDYFAEHELPEDELAYKALQSRWHRYKSLDKQERYIKSAQFLGRRGFNFDIIKQAIRKLEED